MIIALVSTIFLILGLCIGSFLNVVICRLKTGESIWLSRSKCPKCGKRLGVLDLMPILSFVWQRRKCRYCGKKISWQYPLVELTTGLLFLAVLNFHISISTFLSAYSWLNVMYFLIIICFLLVIFVYDLKHYLILDVMVFPAIVLAVLFDLFKDLYFNTFFFSFQSFLIRGVFSALLLSGIFLSLVLISKGKWMGLGDVKLALLMGLVLGWPNILLAAFLAFFIGAVVGLILISRGKKKMKSQIPFGPFLAGATVFAMFFGQRIVDWYLGLILL